MRNTRLTLSGLVLVAAVFASGPARLAMAQAKAESKNMELVGYSDLQGRPAYQPTIQRQGNRYIAYVGTQEGAEMNPLTGKLEGNGTMIVDVTDPHKPVTLAHIPGDQLNPEKKGAVRMVRACDIAGGTYILRGTGDDTGIEVWNVTDPAKPSFVSTVVSGMKDTHKIYWECDAGIAYLPVWDPKWRMRNTKIYNLSNPAKPVFVRDFGLVGQEPGSTVEPIPGEIHGPISYKGRVYFAYMGHTQAVGIQITDRDKLVRPDQPPTPKNLLAPQIGRLDMPSYWGAHTTYPLIGMEIADYARNTEGRVRDFLVVTSESTDRCRAPEKVVLFVDITEPQHPIPVSNFQVSAPSGNFCDKPGRFGPHSVQESFNPIYYKKLVFVAYFNAGLRVVDVRNPFKPVEVAYYIPAANERTKPTCYIGEKNCKAGIQTNNAEVDDRGWIYSVDRAGTGMHILQLTGEARAIAPMPQQP